MNVSLYKVKTICEAVSEVWLKTVSCKCSTFFSYNIEDNFIIVEVHSKETGTQIINYLLDYLVYKYDELDYTIQKAIPENVKK